MLTFFVNNIHLFIIHLSKSTCLLRAIYTNFIGFHVFLKIILIKNPWCVVIA